MNLFRISTLFPDHEACIEHLEEIRFRDGDYCPHCKSANVARKADGHRIGRWNCHDCKSSFNVLSGTIFEKTRVPLRKWFAAIGLMVNAKQSLSSCQLARDLNINQKTAWYMMQRIRAEMAIPGGMKLLQGIVEADEAYIGGRAGGRKGKNPRGRGTRKTPVIGVVERGGQVRAQVSGSVSGRKLLSFIKGNVDPVGSVLMTDELSGYRAVRQTISHAGITHRETYEEGIVHTNTSEGFWALLKRAWYGSHHHYDKQYTPLYVAEQSWKYNNRKDDRAFSCWLAGCFA